MSTDPSQPPSYNSLNFINQLKSAKEESKNPAHFAGSACMILCESVFVTICMILSLSIPIAQIVIGSLYIDQCPIERKIPIWLIVSGAFGCLAISLRILFNICSLRNKISGDQKVSKKKHLAGIIELFLFAWFICGNVWVYSNRSNVQFNSPNLPYYCHQTCYLFSFWIITCSYILVGVFCCCCCCVMVIAGCGLGLSLAT